VPRKDDDQSFPHFEDMLELMETALVCWNDISVFNRSPFDSEGHLSAEYEAHKERKRRFKRAVCNLEKGSAALLAFLRPDGDLRKNPPRLAPGVFARMKAEVVPSFQELIERAVTWCERSFGDPRHIDAFAGAVRALVDHGHATRAETKNAAAPSSRAFSLSKRHVDIGRTAEQRGEGAWVAFVSKHVRPARRGQTRGRKSAFEIVAKITGYSLGTIRTAYELGVAIPAEQSATDRREEVLIARGNELHAKQTAAAVPLRPATTEPVSPRRRSSRVEPKRGRGRAGTKGVKT
jgi:hypothetical protein